LPGVPEAERCERDSCRVRAPAAGVDELKVNRPRLGIGAFSEPCPQASFYPRDVRFGVDRTLVGVSGTGRVALPGEQTAKADRRGSAYLGMAGADRALVGVLGSLQVSELHE
jgi:hypothetical protein